jgi:hypothetical protein
VPSVTLEDVMRVLPAAIAIPKSSTTTRPSRASMMLRLVTSRCTTPCACAWASDPAAAATISPASSQVSGPRAMRSPSVIPST